MSMISSLRCLQCGEQYRADEKSFRCRKCDGQLQVLYDYQGASETLSREELEARHPGVWKYFELLPVREKKNVVSLSEGATPLRASSRLNVTLDLKNLHLKDETRNPTGSFKDRPISVAISKVLEFGGNTVVTASTGNVAASVAAYAAVANMKAYVFMPQNAPKNKMAQALLFGAVVVLVPGSTTDDALRLSKEVAERYRWYPMATAAELNPYTIEGNKTIAFEIVEQLEWTTPDWVVVPVGGGGNLAGNWKGFLELEELGLQEAKPRMVGVQSTGCMPFVDAVRRNLKPDEIKPWLNPTTIASGLADAYPWDSLQAMKAIHKSGGAVEAVSDEEILEALHLLAKTEGIFAEPAAVSSIAALKKLRENGTIDRSDLVVCEVTGSGLKQPSEAFEALSMPESIPATLKDFERTFLRMQKPVGEL